MISKELLSEVLGVEVIEFEIKPKNNIKYIYNKKSKNPWSGKEFCNRSINIYELAHKCKEWASTQKDIIAIIINENNLGNSVSIEVSKTIDEYYMHYGNCSIIKPEHIFEYCQWILDNKEN